jgi:DNA polymerase sigma
MIWAYFLFSVSKNKDNSSDISQGIQTAFNLGSFLKGFLKFYAEDFNYQDLGISIHQGISFFSKWQKGFSSNENLCFENFQERDKDIARGAYQFPQVVKLFREILYKLSKAQIPSNHSYLNLFINITEEMKNRKTENK